MSRKTSVGGEPMFYSYNRSRHCLDARMLHHGKFYQISGHSLGEIKSTLLVFQDAATCVFTLLPARSA